MWIFLVYFTILNQVDRKKYDGVVSGIITFLVKCNLHAS